MTASTQNLQKIARAALNELITCREALFQIEALFLAMKNQDLTRDTLEQLVNLGLSVAGDIANLESENISSLEGRYDEAISAPQNGESQNVARIPVEGSR
ncbi:hypothetical protein H7A76_06405 [Pseudomonas sp. MSSRFD41]|uniref:hypothetical protein n=1 Tax=Pseudomonas sp. MSSRFD41 TaxID=1310370 RepID=UPI00163AD0C9|nr:hypothetical protein [Pseudomonas sp. MSSRFD41]MBC2655067.1 hypothetical protein [Pseudomonas sp. MSSRFD41]